MDGQAMWAAHLARERAFHAAGRLAGEWLGRQRAAVTFKPNPYEPLSVHHAMVDANDRERAERGFARKGVVAA